MDKALYAALEAYAGIEKNNCVDVVAMRSALEAYEAAKWNYNMDEAPQGEPSMDVGCREASEWFLGKRKDGEVRHIYRRAWPHEDGWADKEETYYTKEWFIAWQPLPKGGDDVI